MVLPQGQGLSEGSGLRTKGAGTPPLLGLAAFEAKCIRTPCDRLPLKTSPNAGRHHGQIILLDANGEGLGLLEMHSPRTGSVPATGLGRGSVDSRQVQTDGARCWVPNKEWPPGEGACGL